MRQTVYDYIRETYQVSPEYPWGKQDGSAVFRHSDNKKWFALVMNVPKNRLGLSGEAPVDLINLKVGDLFFRDVLVREDGILPAYHMNKQHWITVLLDGTVEAEKIFDLIDRSFLATAPQKKKEKKENRRMLMLLVHYPKCTTCQKAKKWLDENGVAYEERNIKEDNPTLEELKAWHSKSGLPLKRFFNTSGLLYKEMQLKDKLPAMPEEEQLKLLSSDGMLVKRPILAGEDFVLVGFREAEWKKALGKE